MSNDENVSPEDIRRQPLADRKAVAKQMYFAYATMPSIASALDIKLPTLKTWVYGMNSKKSKGWKVERELAKNQLLKDLSKDKRGMVYNMVDGALFLLHDFVEHQKRKTIELGKPIDVKTAERLTNILMNLHKIVEKESDQDDDATFTKPTSMKELQQRVVAADPFAKPNEVIVLNQFEEDIIIDDEIN